jgi:copper chaperone CopZ
MVLQMLVEDTTQLEIQGMHCNSCVNKVTLALKPWAKSVTVTLDPPLAKLEHPTATLSQINQALGMAGNYQALNPSAHQTAETSPIVSAHQSWLSTYQPLLLIFAYILIITLAINLKPAIFNVEGWMMDFMAGFFLVFSFFKLLNIRAFAESYAVYDLLAMRFKVYGFIYPIIEFGLGIAYLLALAPQITNMVTIMIMGFSSLGVIRAVMNKQKIRCACLGAVFNLPMSTITIIEDLLMVAMAAWMLI